MLKALILLIITFIYPFYTLIGIAVLSRITQKLDLGELLVWPWVLVNWLWDRYRPKDEDPFA